MKLVKSLLLGSAAGLCAAAGAQAADLPMRKAAPVEYVRVCTAYGAGFFYIPGTDTCLRVGGRARFEYGYHTNRATTPFAGSTGAVTNLVNSDNSGFRGLGRIQLDARTQTSYGTLRTFIRIELAGATGGYLNSGTAQRFGTAFPALGIDTFGRAQQQVNVDKAFIQFAGFTAGRSNSFFDFYSHDAEMIGGTSASDVASTNLLAYTMTFGNGFSGTISIEDPLYRRQPVFNIGPVVGTAVTPGGSATFTNLGSTFVTAVPQPGFVAGVGGPVALFDTVQRERMPDFVGVLRYDAPWGAAQVSAAVHEINGGKYVGNSTVAFGATGGATFGAVTTTPVNPALRIPKEEYGYAVQGGLKINLPQIAAGDVLWLQAAYSEGALSYAGIPTRLSGSENLTNTLTRFSVNSADAFVDSTGKFQLTEAWSFAGAFQHYFTPQVRGAVFGSYSEVSFGKGARAGNGPANLIINPGVAAQANTLGFSTALRDYNVATVGANLIWSPVRDLDIGVEAVYQRVELQNGRTQDGNKALPLLAAPAGAVGIPTKSVREDDVLLTRLRIQRDF